MTVATTDGGVVEPWEAGDFGDVGLEDVSATDVVIPRISIVHSEGVFQDNLSKTKYEELDAIILGLVKQRIFWDSEVEDGDKPLCKSPDFEHGFPNMRDDVPANKRFPWAQSNFSPEQALVLTGEYDSNGYKVLPCASCIFQQWNDKKPPPCSEQHVYPLLHSPDGGETWVTALFAVQKTGIKPSRSYLSSFKQARQPMFTVRTKIRLQQQSRGSVRYSVPVFTRGEQTDRNTWSQMADQFRDLRAFIRQAPRPQDEADAGFTSEAGGDDPWAPTAPEASSASPAAASATPAATPAAPPTAPAATSTAVPAADDDDLPF